jgi:hypothetical protein
VPEFLRPARHPHFTLSLALAQHSCCALYLASSPFVRPSLTHLLLPPSEALTSHLPALNSQTTLIAIPAEPSHHDIHYKSFCLLSVPPFLPVAPRLDRIEHHRPLALLPFKSRIWSSIIDWMPHRSSHEAKDRKLLVSAVLKKHFNHSNCERFDQGMLKTKSTAVL